MTEQRIDWQEITPDREYRATYRGLTLYVSYDPGGHYESPFRITVANGDGVMIWQCWTADTSEGTAACGTYAEGYADGYSTARKAAGVYADLETSEQERR